MGEINDINTDKTLKNETKFDENKITIENL